MINFIALAAAVTFAQDLGSANELLNGLQARDAFASAEECLIVDAKTLRPFEREEAREALVPCFKALSSKYGSEVKLAADEKGLAIVVDAGVSVTSPLRRDLGRALSHRENMLLGHSVSLRRAGDELTRSSSLQEVFDACPKPMVIRKIESSNDFLKYYGGCFAARKIDVRVSPAHKLGLMVRAGGDATALNGVISLIASNGPVELMVMAYSDELALP